MYQTKIIHTSNRLVIAVSLLHVLVDTCVLKGTILHLLYTWSFVLYICIAHTHVHMHVLPKRDIDVDMCVCSITTQVELERFSTIPKAGKDSHEMGLDPTTYDAL